MDDLRFMDVQTFGGSFALGATQAGWRMIGKKERANQFGAWNVLSNKHILGENWDVQIAHNDVPDGMDWDVEPAEAVFSNPPCSGFSMRTSAKHRGIDANVNICLWATAKYAGRAKPEVLVFESVTQALTNGYPLMKALHRTIEDLSGQPYYLTHVLHNNAALGGCSIRRRYFFVASRFPLGVELPDIPMVPTLWDCLQDLEPLGQSWERQPYRGLPTWWSRQMHDGSGTVDGMFSSGMKAKGWGRIVDLMDGIGGNDAWKPGMGVVDAMKLYYEMHGCLPDSYTEERQAKLIARDFWNGQYGIFRWRPERPAAVITGGALGEVMHPTLPRLLTHREAARIQGFPDAWRIAPLRHAPNVAPTWGKGIPVHAGRWIAGWARESLLGRPGAIRGERIGPREHIINLVNVYKQYPVSQNRPKDRSVFSNRTAAA